MTKQPLLNIYINCVSMDETIDEISHLIEKKKKSYVVPVNVDVVVKAEKDSYLRSIINNADLAIVDGKPLAWIAKWHKHPVKEKVSGSDLVPKLCEIAADKGYSMFIIGGAEGVAETAKDNLARKIKDIRIVGTYSPPMGFESDQKELSKINNMIFMANPDILIACFGCPKQEKWVYENYHSYNAYVSICAGATVDFLAGKIKRSPTWMSNCGLEWLYRFIKEPRRMFRRYFVCDLRIIGMIFKYRK